MNWVIFFFSLRWGFEGFDWEWQGDFLAYWCLYFAICSEKLSKFSIEFLRTIFIWEVGVSMGSMVLILECFFFPIVGLWNCRITCILTWITRILTYDCKAVCKLWCNCLNRFLVVVIPRFHFAWCFDVGALGAKVRLICLTWGESWKQLLYT